VFPPLTDVLSVRRLRMIAGPAFARGEVYWRSGHVESLEMSEGAVDAVVIGGERYQVRLSNEGGTLIASCTCPVGRPMCKHAVAAGLAFLASQTTTSLPGLTEQTTASGGLAAPSGVTLQVTPPGVTPQVTAPGFATRAELEAWAARHEVTHALWLSAEVLVPRLPAEDCQRYGLRYVLARVALRDVGSRDSVRRLIGVRALEAAVMEAVMRELEEAAAIVRVGCEEERARREEHADPVIAPLWSRLLEMRRAVRASAPPRSRASRRGTWWFDAAAVAVTWAERERVVRGPIDGAVAIAAQLTVPRGGEVELACVCKAPEGRCVHSLTLIDATLDVLEDPARLGEAQGLANELLRPGWARLFEALDQIETRAVKPRTAIEVWWQIEHVLGTVTLAPLVKKQLRHGGMSSGTRPTAARMLEEYREQLAEVDVRIAEQVAAWTPGATGRGPGRGTYPARAFLALVGHPRVIAEWSERPIEVSRVALGFSARMVGEQVRLEPALDGVRCDPALLEGLLGVFAPGEPLVLEDQGAGRCVLVEVADEARQLLDLLSKHGDAFPPESHGPLVERLARMEARLPVAVPEALKGKELAAEATTVVRLRLLPDVTLELELLIRPGRGAPLFQPGSGPRDVMLLRGGERGYVRRALTSEAGRARAMLEGLPLADAQEGPPFCYRVDDAEGALELVSALQEPRPGLEVEWVDARPTVTRGVGPEALRVQVERRRDWFGIAGELKIETGRLELAVLLDAARRQQRFVRVDEGRWLELTEALRQRLLAVADQTFAGRQHLELSPGAVPAIRALAEAGAQVETAPDWQRLTERLRASVALAPKPPAALAATLRDYQVEGHAWLSRVAAWGAGACLADDMGLGKTVQAIAVMLDRARLGPALVIAPTSVAFNWVRELERFAPTLSPVLFGEQTDRGECLSRLRKADVVIASYGLLVRDAELFAATRFATLVLDEAQALKNANTRRARAARKLDAGFRIALSGTPLENHLGELWSLFAIIFPGLLGSWEQFRERFATPIERGKDPEARAALSRVLRPFLLRRTKQEVARELPSRTEIDVPVVLSKEERELYEDARLAAVAELDRQGKGVRDAQRRFQVLAALTRLRLLASHPRLYDGRSAVASSKLRRLLELLDELRSEGHRALVFSQFTSHLALVRDELDRAGYRSLYLDGATAAGQRAKLITEFQAGGADVFLLSLKAGGTGINLTAADYVIHLDPWWNPAVEDQATDRAHRIGQVRPVTVYRLIARGTIEEQILAMHGDKRALVASVLDGSNAAARLTTPDLLALLAAAQGVAIDDDDAQTASA
jgi:superfamily II DNA or RNA helicase